LRKFEPHFKNLSRLLRLWKLGIGEFGIEWKTKNITKWKLENWKNLEICIFSDSFPEN